MAMIPDSWSSYPKIMALGHRYTKEVLDKEVVAEEKIDGSQFSFGSFGGELKLRSKGATIYPETVQDLFKGAVATAVRLHDQGLLIEGWTYRGEAIKSFRHNALTYSRTPLGNVILFDIQPGYEDYLSWDAKAEEALRLGLEVTPRLFQGRLTLLDLEDLLNTESHLGGPKIEGVVVKPVSPVYGEDGKAIMAKYVSEAFKEVHQSTWAKDNPKNGTGDLVERLLLTYKTEARWQKAVQHLEEAGSLDGSPKDIGPLIAEVWRDIVEEEADEIGRRLFKDVEKKLSRGVTAGLPEWYKMKLAQEAFE